LQLSGLSYPPVVSGYPSDNTSKELALRKIWREQALKITMRFSSCLLGMVLLTACTQETQNKIGRAVQNWTGTDGVLEVYAGEKLVKRFMEIDKLSTAMGTQDNLPRAYRFGYGVLDANLNGMKDSGEKKVYFEFSDYSTSYIFYENPT
jgi:hypothetical protein